MAFRVKFFKNISFLVAAVVFSAYALACVQKSFFVKAGGAAKSVCAEKPITEEVCGNAFMSSEFSASGFKVRGGNSGGINKNGAAVFEKTNLTQGFCPNSLIIKTPAGSYEYYYPQLSLIFGDLVLLGLEDEVQRIYCDNYFPAKNAECIFEPDSSSIFKIIPEKNGKFIKKESIKSAILYALSRGKGEVELKAEVQKPEIYSYELLQKRVERSCFRTYYGSSSAERKNNVELAARAINGTILPSGGEFSFNAVVGERTEERGYKKAKIISGGEFVDGVGGGVCQVSGTVYNAALLAGLSVTEWHRHSLAVSYVSPSFDAMVNGNVCDLVFKNDTESDIFIVCRADGEYLSANFFGVKNGYEYKLISRVVGVIEAKTAVEYDETLEPGEKKQIIAAKNGVKSEGYLCAYSGGVQVFSRKIRQDEYSALNGLIKTGDKLKP